MILIMILILTGQVCLRLLGPGIIFATGEGSIDQAKFVVVHSVKCETGAEGDIVHVCSVLQSQRGQPT